MNIAELSVRRPVAITIVYVLICVIAMVFIPKLGIELYPDIELPMLSVITTYNGVGPEEIDQNVTDPIVNAIKGVPGIEEITAISQEGSSFIIVSFDFGEDLDDAYDELNNALSTITRMIPADADAPMLVSFDVSSQPILKLAIDGALPINELKEIAEDTVQPLVERVNGVSQVKVKGGADKIIQIDVLHNRLEAYGLTLSQISQTLAARNVQLSSGQLTQNGFDYEIITTEYYESLNEIKDTVITTIDGALIRIGDVANVYESLDDSNESVYINGVPGLYIDISKESDANASTVAKEVKSLLNVINSELPSGVNVRVLSDDTTLIDSTMDQVYGSAFQGALLAALVIFLFLRNIKSAIIITLTIPISFLITLMVMAMMELSVNIMTMSGLILGMGMVVDSSIVILENIFLHRTKGEKPAIAAILGSKTMINAIVASTLTTLCVFIPMLIYKAELKMLGVLFQDMIITVCVSLAASLFVAITLVPALCGSILKIETRTQKPLTNKFLKKIDDAFAKGLKGLENGYAVSLNFSLKNKLLVLTLIISVLLLSLMQLSNMGLSLAPDGGADDQIDITLEFPIGTTDEVIEDYLFQFQEIIIAEVPSDAYNTILMSTSGSSPLASGTEGTIQIGLPKLEEQTLSSDEIEALLRPFQYNWSGINVSFDSGRGFGGGSNAIDIKILSEDYKASQEVGKEIQDLLVASDVVVDVSTDYIDGAPRYQISIDSAKAATFGVSVQMISSEIKTAVNGQVATIYRAQGDEYDIKVQLREDDLRTTSDLGSLAVNTSQGRISLDNFIMHEESKSPQTIRRLDGERLNHVTAGVAEGYTSTEAQAIVEKLIADNIVLPESVDIEFAGESSDITQMLSAFIIVILLAVFLVFAVMAAQFESLIDPFIIFASIPLLAIGVIAIYLFMGEDLTVFSMVGIVSLAGIVVNNGIVLVDYINQLVDKKTPVLEACVEAGKNRLQPILMSTFTTVLGMVPMAFFPGDGAEMMKPIALTMVGGLFSGSFLTLYVSPILYSMLNKKREKRFDDPMALINQLSEYDDKSR